MTILVKWGRERYDPVQFSPPGINLEVPLRMHIPLPPPTTTLGEIRGALAQYTHLPPHAFKLIHSGAVMKDDTAPISAYGLHGGSTIMIIGGNLLPAPPTKTASKEASRPTEASTISTIQTELTRVRSTLASPVEVFLTSVNGENTGHVDKDTLRQEHNRLGEMLLQSLLRLDAVAPETDWMQARQERKLAVKEVQGMLDRLDAAWKGVTG
ncbi:hypothetical protein FRC02_002528 [Tulasnella sp. 418]|nr:hypothetical protein FRC02_002528 [Tulasnella sp. 418]